MNKFSKKEALNYGWNTTKVNLKFILGLMGLLLLIYILPSIIQPSIKGMAFLVFVFSLVFWVLQVIAGMGQIKLFLKIHDGQKPTYSELLSEYPLFFKFLAASILNGIIVFIGTLLLIIPGIILSIKLQFYPYLIIDKKMGPIEALKRSWEITKGVKWNLFLFGLLMALVNLAGFLALIVGLLVTIPTTILATIFVYRKLNSSS